MKIGSWKAVARVRGVFVSLRYCRAPPKRGSTATLRWASPMSDQASRWLSGVEAVQALFVSMAFGVLLFLTSAAILALDAQQPGPGAWYLSLVIVAALYAASGFLVLGGVPALCERQWSIVAGCAAAGAASAIFATFAATHLAAILELEISERAAHQMVMLSLAAGIVLLVIVTRLDQFPRP